MTTLTGNKKSQKSQTFLSMTSQGLRSMTTTVIRRATGTSVDVCVPQHEEFPMRVSSQVWCCFEPVPELPSLRFRVQGSGN